MTNIKQKFGKRVKELRKNKGFTQEQIAERIGIEPPNISKLEKGTHFPLPENIEKIAKALDVKVVDLFDFEHFSNKNILLKEIHTYLEHADEKEIEFLYKMIYNLSLFKNKYKSNP